MGGDPGHSKHLQRLSMSAIPSAPQTARSFNSCYTSDQKCCGKKKDVDKISP